MNNVTPSHSHSVTVYTDGACVGNPGPGGYGAVLLNQNGSGTHRKELSGGFRRVEFWLEN